jgi:alpha-ketoglutarate-dependent taurine dioxygenase
MEAGRTLPYLVETGPGEDGGGAHYLLSYYEANRAFIETKLLEHGAVLFRGFGVATPAAFARCARGLNRDLLSYVDGNSPRTKLAPGVYTSTEYPAEYFISLHNELSYSSKWPSRLFFCCVVAPQEQGETPIADCRALLRALDPEVVEEFTRKGVKYTRNLHGGSGAGPSWQETFECKERAAVEQYCAGADIDYRWRPDGSLSLTQVRPAVATHPTTKQAVWFNQADQFHPSTHPRHIYETLMSVYRGREDELPQNACFGDGTPIDPAALEHIRQTARALAAVFAWQAGDLLVVDNMLTSHGRMPFTGPRRVLVSMS